MTAPQFLLTKFGSGRSLGPVELDFSVLTPGSLAAASMPFAGPNTNKAILTRASIASVQSAMAALVTGIAVDTPRIALHTANSLDAGLLLEERRVSENSYGDNLGSTVSQAWVENNATVTVTASYAAGPAGTNVPRFQPNSSGFWRNNSANMQTVPAIGDVWSISMWAKGTSAANTYNFMLNVSATGFDKSIGPIPNAWRRVNLYQGYISQAADLASPVMFPVVGQAPSIQSVILPACTDILANYVQIERGLWVSSYIPSAGLGPYTRAGERLYLPDCSTVVRGGRLQGWFEFTPLASITRYGGQGVSETKLYLWKRPDTAGGANEAYISRATYTLTVTVDGSSWVTPALYWAAGEKVKIWIEAGLGGVVHAGYTRNGGVYKSLGTGPQFVAINDTGTIDLMCNGTTGQTSAIVQKIGFYPPGTRPAIVSSGTITSSSTVVADFTSATAGGLQAGDFPVTPFEEAYPYMRYSCAVDGRTVQDSEATLITGIQSHYAPFGKETSNSADMGLSLDRACVNKTYRSNFLNEWTADATVAVTANDTTGPDGTANAERVQWTNTTNAKVQPTANNHTTPVTASCWLKGGVTNDDNVEINDGSTNTFATMTGATKTWHRVQGTRAATASISLHNPTGTAPDVWASYAQHEHGQFATEVMPSVSGANTQITRAAAKLFCRLFYYLTDHGTLSLLLQHRPKGGPTAYNDGTVTQVQIFYVSANYQAYWDKSARTFTIIANGISITSVATIGASDWVAGDKVEWWIEVGEVQTGVKYRVNGGSWFTLIDRTTATLLGTIELTSVTIGNCDIFSQALTNTFSSRVQKITKYAKGERPAGT